MLENSCQSGIYCIRNTVSGRRYVGSSLNIKQRWFSHRSLLLKGIHHSRSLLRSWLKHGESAFVFEILEIVNTPELLVSREQYWIDEFDASNPKTGFNMSPTAGSCIGCKHTPEARAAMSARRKGVKKSEEGAERIRAALLIRNKSEWMREKVKASKLKLYSSPERIQKLREQSVKMWVKRRTEGKVGYPHTEETKRRLSEAKKGKMSDAHKAAIAASNRNRALAKKVFGPLVHP